MTGGRFRQAGACGRTRAEADPKSVNAWRVDVMEDEEEEEDDTDDATGGGEADYLYSWSIEEPRPSFLVPPSQDMRAGSGAVGAAAAGRGARDGVQASRRAHALVSSTALGLDGMDAAGPTELRSRQRRGELGNPISFVLSNPCTGPSCMLVLASGAMIAGQTYVVSLTVTERSSGRRQHASLLVPVLVPPSSGLVTVSPLSGIALETRFELRADGWATEAENLPLSYVFYAVNWIHGSEAPIASQITTSTVLPLPAGDPAKGGLLGLRVRVFDSSGVYALASGFATVTLPPVSAGADGGRRNSESEDMTVQEVFEMCSIVEAHLENQLAAAILDADIDLAHHLIISLAAMLAASSERDPCRHATTFAEVPQWCVNLLVRRQSLRFRLLFNLEKANQTQTLIPSAIEGQAAAMVAITDKPMEMDSSLKLFAVRFLLKAIASVHAHPSVNSEAITQTYGQVLHNIIRSFYAEDPVVYIATVEELRAGSSGARRQGGSTPDETTPGEHPTEHMARSLESTLSESSELWAQARQRWSASEASGRYLGRAEDMPAATRASEQSAFMEGLPRRVAEAREIIYDIMKAMSGISSLSTRQHVPGQTPAMVSTDSFECKTLRVSVAAFRGLEVSDVSEAIMLTLPHDLFEAAALEPDADQVDIMLTTWNIASIPLPRPQGFSGTVREDFLSTVFSIEVRKAWSDANIRFERLATPLRASIVAARSLDMTRDPATGRGLVFAPVTWSWPDFIWAVDGAVQTSQHTNAAGAVVVAADVRLLAHLSIINKMSGCDSIPESPTVIDACNVCGGDNSSCSGCDGIPNTGRDRNCSGHGSCGYTTCSCSAFYFGTLCETYCSDANTCSGHGACNASSGIPCSCAAGWITVADLKDSGPYCTFSVDESLSNAAVNLLQDTTARLLIIIIPAVVACVCIVCVVRVVRKERAKFRKGQDLMVDIDDKKEHHADEDPEPEAIDILPPDDEAHSDMVDLAPYHAKRCADLQEPRKGFVLAVSEQAMLWPKGTKEAHVSSQQRLQSMLHHDKMPEKKLMKYLERGPKASAAQNGDSSKGRPTSGHADGESDQPKLRSSQHKSFKSRLTSSKDDPDCLEEIAV